MQKLFHAIGRNRLLPLFVIAGVVVAWLAPITLLGKMPIGGDVTSFFLPLMAYYRRALLDGRIPLWNELWGFGFPGLAESQMGVFYPPHLILFSLFETETAYSVNIVLHFVLAGWFAYFCGRTFGLKPWGATLAGLIFAGNGFFIIHFPHQWSYTTGCWMPLAVALAWRAVRIEDRASSIEDSALRAQTGDGRRRLRAALGLAAVLAVQMLAGHFQIAFYTQVVVLLIGLLCTLQRVFRSLRGRTSRQATPSSSQYSAPSTQNTAAPSSPRLPSKKRQRRPSQPWGSLAALVWLAAPLAVAFILAALQLLPTYELIGIALPEGRDFEYLSGFANTPFHLGSYLLPTLFHVNPLWRPVAWDPFHTSPEECFSYVGLLPICLAAGAAWRWRREPRVRLWVLLVVVTLLLSLGPYVPWFHGLIKLPGFGGFRSSARWSVTTALFLALLAGRALDGARAVDRLRFWLRGLVIVFILFGALTVGWAWMMVDGGVFPPRATWSAKGLEWTSRAWAVLSPWEDRNDLLGAARSAHKPPRDPWAVPGLARLGYRVKPNAGEPTDGGPHAQGVRRFTLAGEFRRVMLQELTPPVVLLGLILGAVYFWPWHRGAPRWLLLGLVATDLGAAAWLRPTEFTPRGLLIERSSVLAYLAEHARGERVQDFHQNLAMLAGSAPTGSYRTVDIAFVTQYFNPDQSRDQLAWYNHTIDRNDVRWEIWDVEPSLMTGRPLRDGDRQDAIVDPVLSEILYGRRFVQQFGKSASTYVIRRRDPELASRAWLWDARDDSDRFERLVESGFGPIRKPSDRTYFWLHLSPAKPVGPVQVAPERREVGIESPGPGMLIFSDLAYPGWEAKIKWPDGRFVPAQTLVSDAGCLLVRITMPGEYRVELNYRSRPFEIGLAISVAGLAVWIVILLFATLKRRTQQRSPHAPREAAPSRGA